VVGAVVVGSGAIAAGAVVFVADASGAAAGSLSWAGVGFTHAVKTRATKAAQQDTFHCVIEVMRL